MTLTASILAILAAVVPLLVDLWLGKKKNDADPKTQRARQDRRDDAALAQRDGGVDEINLRAAYAFDGGRNLPSADGRDPGRQNDRLAGTGPIVPRDERDLLGPPGSNAGLPPADAR